jgi:hypothetical protein
MWESWHSADSSVPSVSRSRNFLTRSGHVGGKGAKIRAHMADNEHARLRRLQRKRTAEIRALRAALHAVLRRHIELAKFINRRHPPGQP